MIHKTPEVCVVGGGPAGLYTAVSLAALGIHSCVVDPGIKTTDNAVRLNYPNELVAASLPIIRQDIAERLGVEVHRPLRRFEIVSGVMPPWWLLNRASSQFHPRVAVDTRMLQEGLLKKIIRYSDRIRFEQGVVWNAAVTNDRIQSVEVVHNRSSHRISAGYFIDATGRRALLGHLAQQANPERVNSFDFRAPSTILGGISEVPLRGSNLTFHMDAVYIGLTSKRLALSAMSFNQESELDRQKILVYVEGNGECIVQELRSQEGAIGGKRLRAIQAIMCETPWNSLGKHLSLLEPSLFFSYPGPGYVASRMANLVLVGDAQGHTDPLYASGVKNAMWDSDVLAESINSHDEIENAFMEYNLAQNRRYRRLMARSLVAYKIRQVIFSAESAFARP